MRLQRGPAGDRGERQAVEGATGRSDLEGAERRCRDVQASALRDFQDTCLEFRQFGRPDQCDQCERLELGVRADGLGPFRPGLEFRGRADRVVGEVGARAGQQVFTVLQGRLQCGRRPSRWSGRRSVVGRRIRVGLRLGDDDRDDQSGDRRRRVRSGPRACGPRADLEGHGWWADAGTVLRRGRCPRRAARLCRPPPAVAGGAPGFSGGCLCQPFLPPHRVLRRRYLSSAFVQCNAGGSTAAW